MADSEAGFNTQNVDVAKLLYVCQRDAKSRKQALEKINEFLDSWLDGYGSPPQGGGWFAGNNGVVNRLALVEDMVPEFLRLAISCPFEDVRDKCNKMLDDIKERGPGVKMPQPLKCGPSRFIPASEIVPAETQCEEKQMVFIESFLQNNRLEHLHQVMGYHPKYLEAFLKTQNYMLREDGPLPFTYKH